VGPYRWSQEITKEYGELAPANRRSLKIFEILLGLSLILLEIPFSQANAKFAGHSPHHYQSFSRSLHIATQRPETMKIAHNVGHRDAKNFLSFVILRGLCGRFFQGGIR
jgi:hypothetical protein